MPLETDSTLGPVSDGEQPEAEPRSRPPESWMDPVRDGVRARLFDALDPAAPEPEALKIGRYVVIKRIGAGGMGMVYAAYDDQLDRKVAVKLLRPGHHRVSPHAQARLTREAQAIARLSHPSVVKVYEVGLHNDEVFLAMEYVDGSTLKQWQAKRGWKDILGRYVAAGRGLEAAHEAGIVHRDFKADNVLVRRDAPDRADGVRVLDFGLASRDLQDPATVDDMRPEPAPDAALSSLTNTGAVMGTPAYMAPEQHIAMATDGRTDQFSFCVSLFEALHGFRPFAGETLEELRANVLAGAVEDEPRYSEVPTPLSAALRRGLKVDPDERFPSMKALLDELEVDERPRWKRAAVGLGLAAVAAVAVLQFGTTDAGDLVAEAARVRSDFDSTRSANAAEELRALRARSAAQQWDDLVLTYAQTKLSSDPTAVLAALKHLRPASAAWVDDARALAADAARRGPVYDALELDYPIERLVAPIATAAHHRGVFAGISASGALLRVHVDAQGLTTSPVDLNGAKARDVAWTSAEGLLVLTDAGTLLNIASDGSADRAPRAVGDAVRVAVDRDSTRLALGRSDGSIVVSDLHGDAPRELRGAEHPIAHLAFHPHRATLAAAAGSDIWLWFLDRETHRTLEVSSPIEHLAFDNGGLVATTARGGIHRNDNTGAHRNPTWSDDATDARPASQSDVVLEATPEGLRARWGPDRSVDLDRSRRPRDFALSGDGQWAVAGFASQLRAWDLRTDSDGTRSTGERSIRLPAEEDVAGLAATDEGLLVFSASGSVFRIQQADTAEQLSSEAPATTATREASLPLAISKTLTSPEGEHVAVVDGTGALHLASIDNLEGVRRLGQLHPLRSGTVVWSSRGDALITCACPRNGQTCILAVHPTDGSSPLHLGSVPDPATLLRVSPDGSRVLSGHEARTLLWTIDKPDDSQPLVVPDPDKDLVRSRVAVAFGLKSRARIATVDDNQVTPGAKTLRVWESFGRNNTLLELFVEPNLTAVIPTVDADGLVLLTADRRSLLWMLDEDTFRALPDGLFDGLFDGFGDGVDPGAAIRLHLAPDRRHLWIATASRDATLVDLETGRRRTLPPLVPPVAWTADGSVVDVVRFREVRVWSSPAPASPEPFLRWIDAQTRISIDAEAMLSAD